MKRVLLAGACLVGLGLLPMAAQATTIQLGINGDAQVGANALNFGQYPQGAPYASAPGYGTFQVSLVNAGLFASAGVTPGEFGHIQSLNEGVGSVTLPGPFMTFDSGGSNLQLWATKIPASAVGPFSLTDTPNGAVASLNIDGYVFDTSANKRLGDFTSTFAATFNGESVAELESSALPLNTPFSATFTANLSAVPEPASWLLMIVGFFGLGATLRGAKRRGLTLLPAG